MYAAQTDADPVVGDIHAQIFSCFPAPASSRRTIGKVSNTILVRPFISRAAACIRDKGSFLPFVFTSESNLRWNCAVRA